MRAELIAVGTELLLGDVVDTNTAWLSSRLAEVGVDVHRHVTVGDNVERVAAALTEAADRAEVVLVTGGLGPTQDDLTRTAVALALGRPLRRRPELEAALRERFAAAGRPMPASNLVQADLPEGARALAAVGTAPGFAVPLGGATVYCVPGVPSEMEEMVTRDVLGALVERGGAGVTRSRWVRTTGVGEADVAEAVGPVVDRLDAAGNPTVAFLAAGGETRVRITAKAADRAGADALLAPVVDEVVALLGPVVVGVDEEAVEHAVARLLVARGWTLAVAESITGGGVGARLVRVPGASGWFRGGLIVYATPVKVTLAGVDAAIVDRHGPVSEEVAAALAAAARERLGADVGLAVVGVAGPALQDGQEIGTTWTSVALPNGPPSSSGAQLPGASRERLQARAATVALDRLRRTLATAP